MPRDVKRMELSPTSVNSPPRGAWPARLPITLTDPLSNSITGQENDEDYLSPASTSIHSPSGRYSNNNNNNNIYSNNSGEEISESNFRVVIRVRPPVPRELEGYRPYVDVVKIPKDSSSITLCETLDSDDGRGGGGGGIYSRQTFTFDYVYNKHSPQREVYERSAQPAVLSVLQGYNATLIAYGQTGTGKTYTMEGFTSEEERGIIPRAIEEVFSSIESERRSGMRFLVRASYMQIYNEVISDLLKPSSPRALMVRHTPQRGVYVEGLSEWVVRTPYDVYGLIERGTSLRATSTTRMSELSSRSHAMFTIIVEVMEGTESNPTLYRFGKLNIVDLAGSEKVRQAGVTGQRLEETKKINKSLHELGNVISALASKSGGRNRHIPFRNSVLTSALRDSLGGNCKTTLIACISPALESYTESLSTLVFANRAKNIKNTAIINEDLDQATLLRKYELELKRLRQQLQERDGTLQIGNIDANIVSELRQNMRRAEEDREAALEALHESSRAHQQELNERKRFEERIQELEVMLQNGGFKGGPKTSDEYALRLDELDRERQVMEEDKAQVDRYKQLLLKQRDIMLNLTTRLNERDETILQLQEEVDAYDAHIQTLEDTLEVLQSQQSQSQQQQKINNISNDKNSVLISRRQAEEYMQRVRVLQRNANNNNNNEIRYRSETNPSLLLSAEDKMIEMMISNPLQSTLTQQHQQQQQQQQQEMETIHNLDEKMRNELTELAKEGVDNIVQGQFNEQVWYMQCELESMQSQLLASEQEREMLEQLINTLNQNQNQKQQHDPISRTRRLMEEQQEISRKTSENRIHSLQQQLSQERTQRLHLTSEVDTLAIEVRRALESCTTAAQRAAINDVNHLIEKLKDYIRHETRRQLEETMMQTMKRASISAVSQNNNNNNNNKQIATNNIMMKTPPLSPNSISVTRELENQMRVLQKTHTKHEEEWRRTLQEKEKSIQQLEDKLHEAQLSNEEEIAGLTKTLNTHKKDRRALQTIMEQRIKAKIDIICDLLTEGPQLPLQERNRLCTEARALQNLVNASIKAMES